MASQGPNSPGTGSGADWTSPSNITTSNNSYAQRQFTGGGGTSGTLQATSLGFSIPIGATIDGIVVEIERKANANFGGLNITDSELKLIKGGVVSGTNKASGTTWSTTEALFTYGTSTDLWGLSLTDTDINASNFGVSLKVAGNSPGKTPAIAYVDHIRVTVYYTGGGGGGGSTTNPLLYIGN